MVVDGIVFPPLQTLLNGRTVLLNAKATGVSFMSELGYPEVQHSLPGYAKKTALTVFDS